MVQSYRLFALVLLAIGMAVALAQSPAELSAEAQREFASGSYARSAEIYVRLTKANPSNLFAWLGKARAHAMLGERDEAFAALRELPARGFNSFGRLQSDPAFDSLKADPRWAELIASIRALTKPWDSAFYNNWSWREPFQEDLPVQDKVAGLSKVWAEVKFNFPSFDLVPEVDWDQLYRDTLPKVVASSSSLEYFMILREMLARLNDGHTLIRMPAELTPQFARPPIKLALIEGKAVIAEATDAAVALGAVVGAEVLAVNEVPILEMVDQVGRFVSASSDHDRRYQVVTHYLLEGPLDEKVRLDLKMPNGQNRSISVPRIARGEWGKVFDSPPPYDFKMLPDSIALVTIKSFVSREVANQFRADLPKIAQAKGVIFDVRGNNGGNDLNWYDILGSLGESPDPTFVIRTVSYKPAQRARGGWTDFDVAHGSASSWPGTRITAPVVVLADAGTYSAGEDFLLAIDANKRGVIMGETSAGSSGQLMGFDIPGGFLGLVGTMKIEHANGRRFAGIGVEPHIEVRQRLSDFRAGKDTQLAAAVEHIVRGGSR
jgi:carboxyl-terminal processing protease